MARSTVRSTLAYALLTAVFTSPAESAFLDGNELHEYCTSLPLVALGYSRGIADELHSNIGVRNEQDELIFPKVFICIPEGVTAEQVSDVVCKNLTDKPQDRHLPGYILSYRALLDAWRCSQ